MKLGLAVLALGAVSLLAGCDQTNNAAAQKAEPDHWTIIPVPNVSGAAVWRLNTKTGSLEYCWRVTVTLCDPPLSPPGRI